MPRSSASLALVAPKLAAPPSSRKTTEEADAILQAQVAHRAIRVIAAALDAIRRRDRSLADAMLDLLAFLGRLAADIEERWLSKPSGLLEPVEDGCWWGPVRDITPTLRHFRR